MINHTHNRSSKTRRVLRSAVGFEGLEQRQMMSATSIKTIDTGGPEHQMVEAGGKVYAISSTRSGGGWSQLYSTSGPAKTTKLLLDLNKAGSTIASLDDLMSTADGRVFFTATGGVGSGRQLFQLNAGAKGGYTQITKDVQAFYSQSIVIGNQIYLYDSTHSQIVTIDSKNKTKLVADTTVTKLFQAKGQLFYVAGNDGLWRSNGTAAGTYKISGDLSVGTNDVFVSNDWIYFEGSKDSKNSLYRSDGSKAAPVKIADDFSFNVTKTAELGDFVYFSGGYYNTSPNAKGGQLYKIRSSTGEITNATNLPTSNGGGNPDGISAIGTNVYFTAGDTDFIRSQGTTDRELYRYNTITGETKKITVNEDLYPIEVGGGVLSSYYFVAAPTKDDARFGSRALYRTSPDTDVVEQVQGLPSYKDSNGVTRQLIDGFLAGSSGLYYEARNDDFGGDYDTYFVPTPYSYIDPVTKVLTVQATDATDSMTVKVVGNELVMNLNGLEERQTIGAFSSISIALKGGDDKLVTDKNVAVPMSVSGDAGNDSITTGSGNDYILGGAGKNSLFAGAGDDRVRGSAGFDSIEGGDGSDRIYGRGGSDHLHGNNGVDFVYGDDPAGPYGNDTLYGESGNDKVYGFGGDDVIVGGNQNDSLFGGDGKDTVYGNAGNDTLDGGAGLDDLRGDDGDDLIVSNDGEPDLLTGGLGNDKATRDGKEKSITLIEI